MATSEEKKEPETAGIVYECLSCQSRMSADQLAMIPEIKCPYCGYRVLKKTRPPVVKHIKAI